MRYGRRITTPGNAGGRRDVEGGLFELFRWTRSFARAGGADDLVAVVKSVLLRNPESLTRRSMTDEEIGELFDAVLSRRDVGLGFDPSDEDALHMRLLAGNVATLSEKGSARLAERDAHGRIPSFLEAEDLTQAIGISGGLFLDFPDPDEQPEPASGPSP